MRRIKSHSPGLCRTLTAALCLTVVFFQSTAGNPVKEAFPPPGDVALQTHDQGRNAWSFEFRNITLDRALYLISERTGAEFIYEPRVTAGAMVDAEFREKELISLLDALLLPSGLEARRIRTGIYVIRQSMRRALPTQMLTTRRTYEPVPTPIQPQQVPVKATDRTVPLREIIRQIVVP